MANDKPKAIYKTDGVEISIIDTSTDVKKAIAKLSKEALGASGRVIRKKLRENTPLRTKRLKNHIASWKCIDKKTGQPTLYIGYYSWQQTKKHKKLPSHANPHWMEFGTDPHIIVFVNRKPHKKVPEKYRRAPTPMENGDPTL